MTYINLKWQMSQDPVEPFLSISYLYDLEAPLLFFTLKEPRLIVTERIFFFVCFVFFREQLNSLLKTYNIFYANQENLHISYGQVSPSNKLNTVDSQEKKIP